LLVPHVRHRHRVTRRRRRRRQGVIGHGDAAAGVQWAEAVDNEADGAGRTTASSTCGRAGWEGVRRGGAGRASQ